MHAAPGRSAVHVLSAVRLPGGAEVICVFFVAWTHSHQNAAVANALIVLLHTFPLYAQAAPYAHRASDHLSRRLRAALVSWRSFALLSMAAARAVCPFFLECTCALSFPVQSHQS